MIDRYEDLTDGEVLDVIFDRFEHHLRYQHFSWGDRPTEMLIDVIDDLFSKTIEELKAINKKVSTYK